MRRGKVIPIKSKPKFAVVVDGECETWYINMLKRNEKAISVDLKPEIPQKKKLKEQFERVIELAKDYDKVFWIIDFDVINSQTLVAKKGTKTALQELQTYSNTIINKHKNITIIVNNPCLEYWLLLHFEPISKYFNDCNGATKQLSKHLKDYEKTQGYFTKQDNDIYLKLKHLLDTASANARKLGKFDYNNPFTGMSQMYMLLEEAGIIKPVEKK